ncbi:coiled-coil domain-containing protein 40 [Betta splendens]|uniref:Coiled-coil domain-containing protein 40 n=1 Tax=Betta splendens TaxID=158456 RepID=A0A6P7LH58_BETSP|nr:coiled-coil domain-containing protein 40 [Betta splendens]XP_028993650.1 coiled-coil domain-containing protein 40 [Betta splendens]
MQSAGGEEAAEQDGFTENEESVQPQKGPNNGAEPAQEDLSGQDIDNLYLTDAADDPPVATHSVQDVVGDLNILSTLENMEDQEPLQEEEDFIVFDPEHPLVRRHQAALTSQLSKQLEMINLALKEKLVTEKVESKHMLEVDVNIFRIQEQLARLYTRLEGRNQSKAQAEAQHQQTQDRLDQMKSQFSNITIQDREAKAKASQLQTEVDNLMLQLIFTQGVSEDLRSNLKTLKNARNKAGAEKNQAEGQKLKQDLYVERLINDMEKLTQQIALYEAQVQAQAEETQTAKEALSEAEMEMESLLMARKQLLQQWNSSLVGMRKRDEAFSAMQEAMGEVEHQVILLGREIEGYKKAITEEQEQNETLTMQLNWSQMDCATYKKLISQKQAQQEALQAHYSTCLRTLRETGSTLSSLTKETSTYQAQVNDLRRQLEKESAVRLDLEDKVMSNMQQKLTHNKAAKYSQRLTNKMATLKKDKISQLWQLENELMLVRLESSKVSQHVDSLATTQEALDEEISVYNQLLASNQAKVSSFITVIGQKQATISKYHQKICQITASTGHEDLSPMQIQIETLGAEIEKLATNIRNDQQLWMKQQGTLVGLTQEIEANSKNMLKLQTECTAMQQKKIRLRNKTDAEHREQAELEKNAKMLKGDLVKLNTLLSKNGQLSQALEQESTLMESDILHRLKAAEWECVEIQMKYEKTQEEKERLLNCLVEAERQIMLWEKKTQLIKETHSVVDSGLGDIQTMKAEIHRMEVRLNKLMKLQEQLLRESEATVARRETIVLRREAMLHSSHKQTTVGELTLVTQGLQAKIKDTHKRVAEYEQVIREQRESQVSLSDKLEQQRQQLIELCSNSYGLDPDIGNLQDTKDRNLAHLVALQSRTKKLQGVCDGSYKASPNTESVDTALRNQMERVHTVSTVLHRVGEELPQHQGALRRLSLALAARTQALDQEMP